jgi:NAD(P)-dependent dehydrogenase (short-subunit alcohol dehydrogenase family)
VADLFDVSGKTALVTGGSRGIGLMIATDCSRPVPVIVSSRKAGDLDAVAGQLATLGDCEAIPADVSTPDGPGELVSQTLRSAARPELQRGAHEPDADRIAPG